METNLIEGGSFVKLERTNALAKPYIRVFKKQSVLFLDKELHRIIMDRLGEKVDVFVNADSRRIVILAGKGKTVTRDRRIWLTCAGSEMHETIRERFDRIPLKYEMDKSERVLVLEARG